MEVLDAAVRVFYEKGYESTRIEDIADVLGMVKGSLYYYITSKDDLLYDIIREVHDHAMTMLEQISELDGDPLLKIRAFVTLLTRFNADNFARMGIFFHGLRSLSPERRQEIVAARDRYDAQLRAFIREGQGDGTISLAIDVKLASMAIMGSLNSIYQWYRPSSGRSPAQIADQFADLVVAGLACGPPIATAAFRQWA